MIPAAVPPPRAALVALSLLAAAPAAQAWRVGAFWGRAATPGATEAAAATRAAEWIRLVDEHSEFGRARLWPEREDVSHDALRRDALALLDRSLALRPDDPRTLVAAAQLRERLRDHEGAGRDADRALALDPDGPDAQEAHLVLALVRTWRAEHAAARDHYLATLRLPLRDEARALVLGNLGDTYLALGDVPAATESYGACVAVRPEAPLGWLGLAVALDRATVDPNAAAASAVRAASDLAGLGDRHREFEPEALLAVLFSDGVFFVPESDGFYQRALAFEAVARALSPGNPFGATPDAARAARHRDGAADSWRRYLAAAPADEPWRARAEAHLRALGEQRR